MAGVSSRFSIKIVYIKINYFACDLYAHMWRHNFFMYIINYLKTQTFPVNINNTTH
jgi:hypothetical protein